MLLNDKILVWECILPFQRIILHLRDDEADDDGGVGEVDDVEDDDYNVNEDYVSYAGEYAVTNDDDVGDRETKLGMTINDDSIFTCDLLTYIPQSFVNCAVMHYKRLRCIAPPILRLSFGIKPISSYFCPS